MRNCVEQVGKKIIKNLIELYLKLGSFYFKNTQNNHLNI